MGNTPEIDYVQPLSRPPIEWEDVKNMYINYRDSRHTYYTEIYKNYYMYTAERQAQLVKDGEEWRTNIKSPLTNMFTSGIYNMAIDSDLRPIIIDKKGDKPWLANEMLDWAEYFYTSSSFIDNFNSAMFDSVLMGTGNYKSSYMYSKTDVEFMKRNWKKENIIDVDDYPRIQYISPYNFVRWDAYNSLTDRFVIERKVMPAQSILKEYGIYWLTAIRKKSEVDWLDYVDTIDWEAMKINMPFYGYAYGRDILTDQTYNIRNKMMEIFEVTSGKTMSLRINSVYQWTFSTLWPIKRLPHHMLPFKKNPWTNEGIGVWFIVKPIQDAFDTILNYRIDNVKLVLNKIFIMDAAQNLFGNRTTLKIKPWMILKARTADSIKELPISEVKSSAYGELDAMFQMTQWLTGMSSSVLGMQSKVERTAAGAEMIRNASDSQLKPLLQHASRELGQTMKEMFILSLAYTDRETFDKVLWPQNKLKDLDITDLMNDFDFSFEMTGVKSDNLSLRRSQLMELANLSSNLVDATGTPVLNTKVIVSELLKAYNLDLDAWLSTEQLQSMLTDTEKMKQAVQATVAKVQWWPLAWTPMAEAKWQSPQQFETMKPWEMQQIPWAWLPTEMATNPTGVTEAQG